MEEVVWTRFSGNNYDAEVLMTRVPYHANWIGIDGEYNGFVFRPIEITKINRAEIFDEFEKQCEKEQKDVRYCKDGVICVDRGVPIDWEYGEESGRIHVPEVLIDHLNMKDVENIIMKNVNYNVNEKLILLDGTQSICTAETKLASIYFKNHTSLVRGFFWATARMRMEIKSLKKSLETSEKSRQQTESEKSTAAAAFREKAQSLEDEIKKWQDRHQKSEESRLQLETALREMEIQKSTVAVEFMQKIQSLEDMNKKLEESVLETEQALHEMQSSVDKSEQSRQQAELEKSTAAAEFTKKIQSLEEEIDGLQASQLNAEQSRQQMKSSLQLALKSLDTAFKHWTEKKIMKKEKTAENKEKTKWLEKAAFLREEAKKCEEMAMSMDEPESDEEEDNNKTQSDTGDHSSA